MPPRSVNTDKTKVEAHLESASADACFVGGQLCLLLVSRRGLSRGALLLLVERLKRAITSLEAILNA